jgi:carboxymethylenebutenolidase
MRSETITLPTPDGEMPVYEAVPDGDVRGGVLVIQEAFGVNDHIEDVARRLAAEGWHALAPHLFHRDGSPMVEYGDIEKAMLYTRALTAEGLGADIDACLERLGSSGIDEQRVGVVGFCMGGTVTFFAATRRPLGATVTFYGAGVVEPRWRGIPSLVELAPSLQTPWLGLYGDHDHGIPVEQVRRLEEAVANAEVPAEIVLYPNAGHGFHCDQRPQNYEPEAAADGWRRTIEWFARHIG